MSTIHATCVAIDGRGVLLRGESGAGKSDLALRLIDGGATLVADDRVILSAEGGRLFARAPASIAGLIEIRGLGIRTVASTERAPVVLVCDLVPRELVERLPEPAGCVLSGVALPLLRLFAFDASAAAKLRIAVRAPGVTPAAA